MSAVSPPTPRGLDPDLVVAAAREGILQRGEALGLHWWRFANDFQGIDRGTVLLPEGTVLPGYPHIPRVFVLDPGLERLFDAAPFWVEEKIDGYNVRVVFHEGRLLPFTRGGHLCPFTYDRLPDLGGAALAALLTERPELVAGVEVAGPGNPYIPIAVPRVAGELGLFLFELTRLPDGTPLPPEERYALAERHGVPQVPRWGRFTVPDGLPVLYERLRDLDAEGGEGIVCKAATPAGPRVKYVVPTINATDVAVDAPFLAELPPAFYVNRVLRLAIAVGELGLEARLPELARRVGSALVEGFARTVAQVRAGGDVAEELTIRLHDPERAEELVRLMNRASHVVSVRIVECVRDTDDLWRIRLHKTHRGATDRVRSLLAGTTTID